MGTLHALSAPYALAPGATGRLAARLGQRFFLHAGTPADPTDGGLFTTRLTDVATRGGWGEPQRTRARRAASGVGLVAAAGAAARLLRPRSASGQAVPGRRGA